MGWLFGSKREPKPAVVPSGEVGSLAGLELNASWVRGTVLGLDGSLRLLRLAGESALPQAISLEKRKPEVGFAGLGLCCRAPHVCCTGFLPLLGQSREWRVGRHHYDPDSAQRLVLIKVHPHVAGRDGLGLCLPIYLSLAQTNRLIHHIESLDWPLRITTPTPLALAELLFESVLATDERNQTHSNPIQAIVIDVDDYGLSAAVVQYTGPHVQLLREQHFVLADLATRIWKDRIIDGMADYCIQQSNFDPRESGQTEQMLFDQTEQVLQRWQAGESSSVSVQGQGWGQRLDFRPADLEYLCQPLATRAANALTGLFGRSRAAQLRAVWLTDQSNRLPGLNKAIKRLVPSHTVVQGLSVDAVGHAGARLALRWKQGTLTGGLYETSLPTMHQPNRPSSKPSTQAKAADQSAGMNRTGSVLATSENSPEQSAVAKPTLSVEPSSGQVGTESSTPTAPTSKKPLPIPPGAKRTAASQPPTSPQPPTAPPPAPAPPSATPTSSKPIPKQAPDRPTPPTPPKRPRISFDE